MPEDLAARAGAYGLSGLALLDRDGVYGAPRLYGAAREAGIRPIVGAEVTLADGSALPLLARTRVGYQNLCRLITQCRMRDVGRERKRPCMATWEEVGTYADGLVAMTGDNDGPVLTAWRNRGEEGAHEVVARLREIFGTENLLVEVQRHHVRGEDRAVGMLLGAARAFDLMPVATGGVDFADASRRDVADVFTCLRHHITLDHAGRLLAVNAARRLRAPDETHAVFRDLPDLPVNAVRAAERLEFTLRDLGYVFPEFPVPPGESMASFLHHRTFDGAAARFPSVTPRVRAQLDRELALIEKLGFCGYFLVVWDICRWARARGILVQGRGSAANSAVCFALGITAVDPIARNLLFERFLSEGRVGADGTPSWPDIDLDFPSGDLREEVLQEVYRRHGPNRAAMTANVITYRGRSAAREIGKVLGIESDVMDRFSSLFAGGDYRHTLKLREQLVLSGLPEAHPRFEVFVSLFEKIHRLPRHLGQHSGGMVLCGGRLDEIVPLEPATMPGRVVVQWDKDDCEDLGIVKVDFLGLGMMAVLQDTLRLCGESGAGPVELHQIPQDDEATFEAMRRADTIGVFQVESRAQMTTLRRFKPATFYDVAIQVAIVRPGPIVGKLVHPIIRRRAGKEAVDFIDPSVEDIVRPILERSYGVVLFQEQMLALAMRLAALTASEAEELRRAMGFQRDQDRLQRALVRLRAAMAVQGRNETVIARVCDAARSFALYGFPESHAISFALLAYASTWLKVHRPAEFFASLLNNQPMGFYGPATLIQDARRHGMKVLPVCVNASLHQTTVAGPLAIRLGLHMVKGLRADTARDIAAARPFSDLPGFLARTPCNTAERRALAAVGALNALAGHRRDALWNVEGARSAELLHEDPPRSPLVAMTPGERLAADFAGTHVTTGPHPMKLVRDRLPNVWRAVDLPLARNGDRVTIAGSVICRQRPGTAKGCVFLSLEDETGVANAIVRPETFERLRLIINTEPALQVTGPLQNEEGVIHIRAEKIEPLGLAEIPAQASHDFH
jgi:error-prone DNA polymerase